MSGGTVTVMHRDADPRPEGRLPLTASHLERSAAVIARDTAEFVARSAHLHRESEGALRRLSARLGRDPRSVRFEPIAHAAVTPAR